MARIAVIGAGFSGLSAAAYLSAAGHEVHVFEKNATAGGRARQLKTDNGYTFDMGPSWYWMPDIFEEFFSDFGFLPSDFYELKLLNPAFEMVFDDGPMPIPSDFSQICQLFESVEKGSSKQLINFIDEAKLKYETGMKNMAYMPGLSLTEFVDINVLKQAIQLKLSTTHLKLFSSFSNHVRKFFFNPKLISLLEFPVLFLGAMPQKTPALYSLMNYAGLKLGTWYPQGGFGKVVESMKQVAEKNGAMFHFNAEVEKISVEDDKVKSVTVNEEELICEAVIASADYHHVEKELLPHSCRNYSEKYWKNKTFAPSCLIFYLGISKRINDLKHHTLFFEEDLLEHSKAIYENPRWPKKPLFYVCCPSQTDDNLAPEGHETLFLLMPIAPGLKDKKQQRERYFNLMMNRLEKHAGTKITSHIEYKQSYCIDDFKTDYNSYKGNAYGLANTLSQTAVMKPKIRNKKLDNLFYAGQLTVPGPGVPPALISGKIAARQLLKHLNKHYEVAV
jgi:phytoene desaturase